jgi:Reverse transcriptase (RNA-dependent DNA polymerase)
VTGDTPDISEYLDFSWYEAVWYYEPTAFPEEKRLIGRWMGVAHRVGQALCYWILTSSGTVIARTTVQALSPTDLETATVQQEIEDFDKAVLTAIGDATQDEDLPNPVVENLQRLYDMYDERDDMSPIEPEASKPEADDHDVDAYDKYISAQVMLPQGNEYTMGRVISRKRDENGTPIGRYDSNPILDTRMYNVEFPDGHADEYTANLIAESLYSQVDDEGNEYLIMKEISDHKKDGSATSKDDAFTIGKNGNQTPRRTTRGWKLCVQWKDGSTSWESLKDLKESNPVEVAEYAVANKLVEEPAFAWWVKPVLRRRDRIIHAVKSRTHKRTHKFRIQVPRSVKEALSIDREYGNDLWYQAIMKEMKNVMPAFQVLDEHERVPIGYKWIPVHMIFDVKMDFTRKARLVAGGHVTDQPPFSTYSSVVSRESVRIAFTIAALNGLDVLMADIGNAYLNANTKEKVWTTAGDEFGSNSGKKVVIVRALYGLKSSGAAWRSHLAQSLRDMEYQPCLADPDVWMRTATKPNGFKYYEYLLVYVDDILSVSHQPLKTMEALAKLYRLKEGSVGPPD